MKINSTYIAVAFLFTLFGCRKYESYTTNFDYTAVYFATQKPVRTIVAYDNMQFKVGVALGGVRENKKDEKIIFQIDPSLLNKIAGADRFRLLPSEYYILSNNAEMMIKSGSLIGDITVTIKREFFTKDTNAVKNYYALPLRIITSTTDSILRGNDSQPAKDYTIVVIRYISPFNGFYYHKGIETNMQTNVSKVYSLPDLSKNFVWEISTISRDTVLTSGSGANNSGRLKLSVDNSYNVKISTGNNVISNVTGNGIFDNATKQFYLSYNYSVGGENYFVKDTLIQRQPPERDLRFEEW